MRNTSPKKAPVRFLQFYQKFKIRKSTGALLFEVQNKTKLTFELKIEQKGLLFSFGEKKFEFLGRVPNFPCSFFQIESNFRL